MFGRARWIAQLPLRRAEERVCPRQPVRAVLATTWLSSPMPQPHDRFFRRVFSEPENAKGELAYLLPDEVARNVDWDTLRVLPKHFVDENLSDLESDLLWSVQVRGREALLYLLVEHQSGQDPMMLFRLLGYIQRALEEYRRANPDTKNLPAVVPFVIYHGPTGWTAPRTLVDLYDLDDDLKKVLRPHLVDFRFILDDLCQTRSEELHSRALSALALLCLDLLKESRAPNLLQRLEALTSLVRRVLTASNGATALAAVFSYTMEVGDVEAKDMERIIKPLGKKGKEALVSAADKLRAEGRAEGRVEGRVALVLRQLQLKFGALDKALEAKVESASSEALDKVAELILSAESLDDVVSPLG